MQFNGSIYFTDYESLQVAIFSFDDGQQIRDAGNAETKGFEGELSYALTDGIVLIANYSHMDTEIVEGALSGQTLAYAPEDTF